VKRRAVLAVLLSGAGIRIPASAQPPAGAAIPAIGVLSGGPLGAPASNIAFERGLRDLGWNPGQTIRIEYRYAGGQSERIPELASELVREGVKVIVVRGATVMRQLRGSTANVPLVMAASGVDPVKAGWAVSFARPGGLITGLTLLTDELVGKQLEILRETLPVLSTVGVLGNPDSGGSIDKAQQYARTLGVAPRVSRVRRPAEIDGAFRAIKAARVEAVVVLPDLLVLEANQAQVVALAAANRLPCIYWLKSYVEVGGLMSYGTDLVDIHRQSARYVDRILKGARPGDLPIEEPTKFELVINARTARALGLTISPSLLLRADRIIE
jgi:putative tryptophan/tyrosine transport system substrate-binding protein